MISSQDITGLILAGGRGSRMGGVDKGLQMLAGRPIAAHVIERLQPQVGALMINANRHTDAYRTLGAPVVADANPESFLGPLAGMLAGLLHCPTPWLVTAPCDSPFLPRDLVQRLADTVSLSQARPLAMACTRGEGGRLQREPVFSLMHRDMASSLSEALARGESRIVAWALSVGCAEVVFDDIAAFANINTPEDLQAHDRP